MGSNVQKIDLEELRKAREALDAEMGISHTETYVKPKKNVEEVSKTVPQTDDASNSQDAQNDVEDRPETQSQQEDPSVYSDESELPQEEETTKEKDLSVYDSFAPFEINSESEVPSIVIENEQNEQSEQTEDNENSEENEESIDDIINEIGQFLGDDPDGSDPFGDMFDDDEDEENEDEDAEEEEDASEDSNVDEETSKDVENNQKSDLESKISSFEDAKAQHDLNNENDEDDLYENLKNVTESAEVRDYLASKESPQTQEETKNDNSNEPKELESNNQKQINNNKAKIESPQTEPEEEKPQKHQNSLNIFSPFSTNSEDENKDEDLGDNSQNVDDNNDDILNGFEDFESPQVLDIDGKHNEKPETQEQKEKQKPHTPVFANPFEEEPDTDDEDGDVISEEEPQENDETKSEDEEEDPNLLKKIPDSNFIDIIRSKSFMSSDNFTCIYGTDEQNNVFCQNFKDFYNTIIFNQKDKNVFRLFSSIIMSLLLKNSNFDIKFAILDSKSGGDFSIYNNLSYMFFNRVAESNRDIIECLSELHSEIDSRYESLAKARVKNIESFNDKMKKAKIAPLPYLIIFFNDYTRASHLDALGELDSQLSYILRFGRLVGVYVNIVAFDENIDDNINFNLQTGLAFKTDLPESSASQIGEEGAEKLASEDEYLVKTMYSDKLFHLKPPMISKKEIELLIKNIEK